MAKSVPAFKRSENPKVGTGRAEPFSDAKIKGHSVVPTTAPNALRKGFVKKLFTVACGKGKGLPGKNDL